MAYTVPTDQAAARLEDLSENQAESFSGRDVTNNTPAPLTASVHGAPNTHDGQTTFKFELRFSEDVSGLSYATLRDYAFTVTGGKVQNARRLARPKNIRWEIEVKPSSNGGVTIVLPITENCAAQGAICDSDGRKLSTRLEITLAGPGG